MRMLWTLLLVVSGVSASAQTPTPTPTPNAAELFEACAARDENPVSGAFCEGFILGIYHGMMQGAIHTIRAQTDAEIPPEILREKATKILEICIPPATSNTELIQKVTSVLTAQQDLTDQDAYEMVLNGLRYFYWCPNDR